MVRIVTELPRKVFLIGIDRPNKRTAFSLKDLRELGEATTALARMPMLGRAVVRRSPHFTAGCSLTCRSSGLASSISFVADAVLAGDENHRRRADIRATWMASWPAPLTSSNVRQFQARGAVAHRVHGIRVRGRGLQIDRSARSRIPACVRRKTCAATSRRRRSITSRSAHRGAQVAEKITYAGITLRELGSTLT